DVERPGGCKLGPHDVEIEAVRSVGMIGVAACRCLVIGHENAARDAPTGRARVETGRFPALDVVLDMRSHDVRSDVASRDAGPPAAPCRSRAGSARADRGDRDRRMRALEGTNRNADSDIWLEPALGGGLVELALDAIRRLVAPDAQHVLDRFLRLAVAVRIRIADRLGVGANARTE